MRVVRMAFNSKKYFTMLLDISHYGIRVLWLPGEFLESYHKSIVRSILQNAYGNLYNIQSVESSSDVLMGIKRSPGLVIVYYNGLQITLSNSKGMPFTESKLNEILNNLI